MAATLQDIQSYIRYWNDFRSHPLDMITLISRGHYFHITREMYDAWKGKEPEYIHAYLAAIPEWDLSFYLIDSVSDKEAPTNIDNIYAAPYLYSFEELQTIPSFSNAPGENVDVLSGLERSFRWNLNRATWIENKIAEGAGSDSGIFQVIHIPWSDVHFIFHETSAEKAVVVFGLREDNSVELLVWSEDFQINEALADVAYPIPPFTSNNPSSDYQLLDSALSS